MRAPRKFDLHSSNSFIGPRRHHECPKRLVWSLAPGGEEEGVGGSLSKLAIDSLLGRGSDETHRLVGIYVNDGSRVVRQARVS